MSKFSDWTRQSLQNTFHLKRDNQHAPLMEWLELPAEISEFEKTTLTYYQGIAKENMEDWNEEDLKFKFIGPVIGLVNYENEAYRDFLDRNLSGKIDNEEVQGKADFMIASGSQEPEKPYFCFHEYKREIIGANSGDPSGQCLVAMLVAQNINEYKFPIYGAYVIGATWRFMSLEGHTYGISRRFVSDTDDIFDIFRVLKSLKILIKRNL